VDQRLDAVRAVIVGLTRRALGGAVLALGACSPWQPEPVRTLAPGTLRVGTYFVNPPFEYVSNGQRIGFEVDLLNEIARRLALTAVFVDTEWETILQQMQAGQYDVIVGGITITPERERILAWSTPYMTTTLSIVIDSRRSPQIRSIADLRTASVGVQAATTDYDVAVKLQYKGQIGSVKVYSFDHIQDAMVDLAAGRITAVMKVYPVAAWLARQTPDVSIVAQVPDDPQPLGIGFAKGNPGLLAAVNRALADMKRDGTYARLAQKWGVP
jgi:ABC-type amino acid transport substrate-binding protein